MRDLAQLLGDRPTPRPDEPLPDTTLLTSAQIDDLLGIPPNRLKQWVFRKKLEPVQRGRRPLLFLLGDVEKCMENRRRVVH